MRGFIKIRTSLGNRVLNRKKKRKPRNKTLHNFKTADSAGIVFDAMDVESFKHVKEFSKFLRSQDINISLLGFAEAKELPDQVVLWDNCELISLKDVNWLLRPVGPVVEDFMNKEFNILFDLSLEHYFSLCYITTLSVANFKVGRYTLNDNDYDFMINIDKNPSVEYFIEQLKNYISILNN